MGVVSLFLVQVYYFYKNSVNWNKQMKLWNGLIVHVPSR